MRSLKEHEGSVVLQRTRQGHQPPKFPDRVLRMTKHNRKMYADLGLDSSRMFRVLTVLNTGAGPNFIRQTEISPEVEKNLKRAPPLEKYDANNRPLLLVGTVKQPVRLETFFFRVEFIVCQRLKAPVILGADF